jgi:hypothetical protein
MTHRKPIRSSFFSFVFPCQKSTGPIATPFPEAEQGDDCILSFVLQKIDRKHGLVTTLGGAHPHVVQPWKKNQLGSK